MNYSANLPSARTLIRPLIELAWPGRITLTNLPLSYVHPAPTNSTQLHQVIMDTYGIDAYHAQTSTNWTNHA